MPGAAAGVYSAPIQCSVSVYAITPAAQHSCRSIMLGNWSFILSKNKRATKLNSAAAALLLLVISRRLLTFRMAPLIKDAASGTAWKGSYEERDGKRVSHDAHLVPECARTRDRLIFGHCSFFLTCCLFFSLLLLSSPLLQLEGGGRGFLLERNRRAARIAPQGHLTKAP